MTEPEPGGNLSVGEVVRVQTQSKGGGCGFGFLHRLEQPAVVDRVVRWEDVHG